MSRSLLRLDKTAAASLRESNASSTSVSVEFCMCTHRLVVVVVAFDDDGNAHEAASFSSSGVASRSALSERLLTAPESTVVVVGALVSAKPFDSHSGFGSCFYF